MSWLNDWLKQLILIILLASFIELLLPSQTMQRYVRTVIGLFLLLALLSPVFQLVHADWNADRWVAAAVDSMESRGNPSLSGTKTVASLAAIMEKSGELKRGHEQEAVRLTEIKLADEIKADIEQTMRPRASVTSVQVRTNLDHSGTPFIEKVEVALSYKSGSRASEDHRSDANEQSAERRGIAEIKPVDVRIEPVRPQETAKPTAAMPDPSAGGEQLIRDTIALLGKEWHIPEERIAVTVASPEPIRR